MNYTKSIGNVNELKCMAAIMELGYDISIPYGDSSKYDFIVDINGKLLKFQYKSATYPKSDGRIDKNAFMIHTCMQTTNTKTTIRKSYTKEDIDYFITSFLDKVYVIPITDCPGTVKTLRLKAPKSNVSYTNAEQYLIENVFGPSKEYTKSKEKYLIGLQTGIAKNKTNKCINVNKCSECGAVISRKAKLCIDCYKKSQLTNTQRPSRETLKQLIRSKSFLSIGKQFGVSDNTIKKWCKSYKLPHKTADIKVISDEGWITI